MSADTLSGLSVRFIRATTEGGQIHASSGADGHFLSIGLSAVRPPSQERLT